MTTIDPKYDAIIASLRERGLDDLVSQLISVAQTDDSTKTQEDQQTDTKSDSALNKAEQQQLHIDLTDFSHLPNPNVIPPTIIPTTATLNFSAEGCTAVTSHLATVSPCGRHLAIYDGNAIYISYTDDFFSATPSSLQNRGSNPNPSKHPTNIPRLLSKWSLPSAGFVARGMKWSPIENTLFVHCTNSTILLYTIGHPVPLHIRDLDDISSFDIHPTGKFMLLASRETPLIKLYDLTTFTSSLPFYTHSLCTKSPPTSTTKYVSETNQGGLSTNTITPDSNNNNDDEDEDGNNYDITRRRNKVHQPPGSLHEGELHVIQSTDLPQFPVYDIKYSNFAAFFAVMTMSPQLTSNLPTIQVRIYNTTDHSLVNAFNLPQQPIITDLASSTQQNSDLNTIDPTHNATTTPSITPPTKLPSQLDPSICPFSLHWSPNDRFLLVTTPFQPLFPTIPPTAYLFNIHDGTLLLTYQPPIPTPNTQLQTYDQLMKTQAQRPGANVANTANFNNNTLPNGIPQPNLSRLYTGFKAFFSIDSQHVFVVSPYASTLPYTVSEIGNVISVFRTVNGNRLPIEESYFTNGKNTSYQSQPQKPSTKDSTTPGGQYKLIGIPTTIFPDASRHCFYLFCHNSESFMIEYAVHEQFE